MGQRGGTIINIGSLFSDRAALVQSIYSGYKHAMKGFTDALRMELEADGLPIWVTLIKLGRIDTPYAEHARSYQAEQPSHRGMVYPPESVAEAILYCAEHQRRNMYVGSQARLAAMFGAIAPRLTDLVMEATQLKAHKSDRPSRGPDDNALYHAGYGMQERAIILAGCGQPAFTQSFRPSRSLRALPLQGQSWLLLPLVNAELESAERSVKNLCCARGCVKGSGLLSKRVNHKLKIAGALRSRLRSGWEVAEMGRDLARGNAHWSSGLAHYPDGLRANAN